MYEKFTEETLLKKTQSLRETNKKLVTLKNNNKTCILNKNKTIKQLEFDLHSMLQENENLVDYIKDYRQVLDKEVYYNDNLNTYFWFINSDNYFLSKLVKTEIKKYSYLVIGSLILLAGIISIVVK